MIEDVFRRLQGAKSDEDREWLLLEMNMAQMSSEVQEAVWAAAVPHWFDIPYLAAVLAQPIEPLQFWEQLITLSFVEPFPGRGYNIHERTRHLLLKQLWQTNPRLYREYSSRAESYCFSQKLKENNWYVEWVYHTLLSESTKQDSFLNDLELSELNKNNLSKKILVV